MNNRTTNMFHKKIKINHFKKDQDFELGGNSFIASNGSKVTRVFDWNKTLDNDSKFNESDVVAKLRDVNIFYKTKKGQFHAVKDVSLNLFKGEVLGLVGESGSGKSTLGKALTKQVDHKGEIKLGRFELPNQVKRLQSYDRQIMLRKIQMIFQDPTDSLNPYRSVKTNIREGQTNIEKNFPMTRKRKFEHKFENNEIAQYREIKRVINSVGFDESILHSFPLELSGGQQQRISIGRALLVHPKIIVADEPISALDVSIQAQVINILNSLREENNLTLLFIAHDLRMVEYISTRIAVMNQGRIVEILPANEIADTSVHPYTKTLLSAVPSINEFDVNLLRENHRPEEYVHTNDSSWWKLANNHFVYGNSNQLKKWCEEKWGI